MRAGVLAVEVAAIGARPDGAGGLGKGRGQRQHARFGLLQHLQRRAAGTARPHARQLGEQADQMVDFRAAHAIYATSGYSVRRPVQTAVRYDPLFPTHDHGPCL